MTGASKTRGRKIGLDRTDTVPVTDSVGNVESSNVSGESGKPVANQSAAEFAATLHEIDEAINAGFETQNLNKEVTAVTVEQNEQEIDMEVTTEAKVAGNKDLSVQLTPRSLQLGEHVLFTAEWVDKDRDKKGRKGEACGTKIKVKSRDDRPRSMQATEPKPNGTWTRMHARQRNVSAPIIVDKDGPKRKKINQIEGDGVIQEKEKRLRMEEETKNLSMLMASEFKSVEVAMQPRREQ